MKRTIDLVLSGCGVLALGPVLALVALAIKLEDGGPLLYRGVRAGRHGQPFRIMKFRSMVMDAERLGGPSTSGDDPRVTRVGAFLRRFKLDELPQLFNILAGQMSFVGPRPEVLSEVDEYDEEQRNVLELRPGITDWASIWNADEGAVLAGAADPHAAYKKCIQPTKLALQLRYLEERSFWLDLRLVFYTLFKIVRKGWVPPELLGYPPPAVPGDEKAARPSASTQM